MTTTRPVASVMLGTISTANVHAFAAVSTSAAASRPFKNTPTVAGVNKGAAKPSRRSRGASARAETTSGEFKLSLSCRQLDPRRQNFHSDARLAGNLAQEGALARIALDQSHAGRLRGAPLPLVGRGWGWGDSSREPSRLYPHPCPLPAKGRGTTAVRGPPAGWRSPGQGNRRQSQGPPRSGHRLGSAARICAESAKWRCQTASSVLGATRLTAFCHCRSSAA